MERIRMDDAANGVVQSNEKYAAVLISLSL